MTLLSRLPPEILADPGQDDQDHLQKGRVGFEEALEVREEGVLAQTLGIGLQDFHQDLMSLPWPRPR